MRLWSIHPRYLDRQGLIALWREALLAQKVLAGQTRGYRYHPQLIRFRETGDPLVAIGDYLHPIAIEAERRGYHFDRSKILRKSIRSPSKIPVTRGQLRYESEHLLRKLKKRSGPEFRKWASRKVFSAHPSFRICAGGIESWEKV